jgi:hypothetical protein
MKSSPLVLSFSLWWVLASVLVSSLPSLALIGIVALVVALSLLLPLSLLLYLTGITLCRSLSYLSICIFYLCLYYVTFAAPH